MSQRRILLYSHNTRGLGHAARNAAIAYGIYEARPQSAILSITGASAQVSELLPPNADYVKLPSFDAVERDGELIVFPQRLPVRKNHLTNIRSAIIEAATLSFDPDVILVDFSPLGKAGEITRTLERVRATKPGVRIYLGIRDILGRLPDNSDLFSEEAVEFMNAYYDAVLYYGDAKFSQVENDPFTPWELRRSGRLHLPLISVGYVASHDAPEAKIRQSVRSQFASPNEALVIASAGGGKHADEFLETVIRSKTYMFCERNIQFLVVTGPYADTLRVNQLRELGTQIGNTRVLSFAPNMIELFASADAVIGLAGYNTMTEIAVAGPPAVIVPRQQIDSAEQSLRAELFRRSGLCKVLEWNKLTPSTLGAAITHELGTPRQVAREAQQPNFEGRHRVADIILRDEISSRDIESPGTSGTLHLKGSRINPADLAVPLARRQAELAPGIMPQAVVFHAVHPSIIDELAVTPAFLSEFLDRTSSAGLQPISAEMLAATVRGETPLELRRCFVLTFDDAYCDFGEYALPVIMAHNAACTLFVPTDLVGKDNTWNPKARFLTGHMDWRTLRALVENRIDIGSHGASHRSFSQLDPQEREQELDVSRRRLEDALGVRVASFAYPYGDLFPDHQSVVGRYYQVAFGVHFGGTVWPLHRFNMRRREPLPFLQNLGLMS